MCQLKSKTLHEEAPPEMEGHLSDGVIHETSDLLDERMNIVTTNNPNTYTTYTAWNPYTQYTYLDLFFGRLDAGLQITYNDNTTYDDSENIKQAIIDMDSY